jgi:acetate---CoA ligase (ADP-forming)
MGNSRGGVVSASVLDLLSPRSIAVIGASSDLNRIGGQPIKYLQAAGYEGSIYPVNPARTEIGGLRSFPGLGEVPGPVDLAIVALPAEPSVVAVRECAAAGVPAAVVFASGFAETGEPGRALQAEMVYVAHTAGMRLIGPNCAGFINIPARVTAAFGTHLSDPTLLSGKLAFVGQSGAVGAYLFSLARARAIGLSQWITTGNEADLQVADFVGALADDPETRVICTYLEQVRDGERLMRAVDGARAAGKPVLCLWAGRSAAGKDAVRSHTAALAGDAAVLSAALREMGVVEVESLDDLLHLGVVLVETTRPRGKGVGILSVSGGMGILLTDRCVELGLDVPELPDAVQAELRAMLPYAGTRNPVDFTGNIGNTPHVFGAFLDVLLDRPEVDVVVCFLGHLTLSELTGQRFVREAGERSAARRKPVWIIALDDPAGLVARTSRERGLPLFEDSRQCVDVLALALAAREGRSGVLERRAAMPDTTGVERLAPLSEVEARALLRAAGVPAPREVLVHTAAAAEQAARDLGAEVVVKVVSRDLAHKTEAGAVRVGVTAATAARAFEEVLANVRGHVDDVRVDGVLVQQQVAGAAELIVGVINDAAFGPAVVVGWGGVLVELVDDRAVGLAPLDHAAARRLLDRTAAARVLSGLRGHPPLDVDAVVDLLVRVSEFAWTYRDVLCSLDLNPVVVAEVGGGAVPVDVYLEWKRDG